MFTQLGAMTPRILRVGYEAWEKSSSYMDANATHRKQKTGLVTTTVLGPRSWFRTPRRDRRAECSLPATRPALPQAHPGLLDSLVRQGPLSPPYRRDHGACGHTSPAWQGRMRHRRLGSPSTLSRHAIWSPQNPVPLTAGLTWPTKRRPRSRPAGQGLRGEMPSPVGEAGAEPAECTRPGGGRTWT